jgi:hypothetical protein
MSIGSVFSALGTGVRGLFNTVFDVGEKLPGVGSTFKQISDAKNSVLNAGDSLFGNRQGANTSATDDSQEKDKKTSDESSQQPSIGNVPGMKKEGEGAAEAKEGESAANAAKAAAAEDAAAEEMAVMLV